MAAANAQSANAVKQIEETNAKMAENKSKMAENESKKLIPASLLTPKVNFLILIFSYLIFFYKQLCL